MTIRAFPTGTRIAVPLPPAFRPAIRTTLGATLAPGRDRDNLHDLYRIKGIIAGDDQVAGPGEFFAGVIAQDDFQRGAGTQSGRERIVDELPVSIGVADCNARGGERAV